MLQVPDIFLKETVKSVGQYIIEEAFYPLPSLPGAALRGLDAAALPALFGYNGTSPKNTARIDLATPRGYPLLATWQYGLGRAAAWTSDLKSQWAADWVGWEGYQRFTAQLVGWLLPTPQPEGLSAQVAIENGRVVVRLNAADKDGRPLNYLTSTATLIAPDLKTQEVNLSQVGAGKYEATLDISEPGTYLVRLGVNQGDQSLGQQTLGLVVPYSPEYKAGGVNSSLLNELAELTGGGRLEEVAEAFIHNLPTAAEAREIWRPLLLLVAWLFPLDVGVRRVMLGASDFRKAFGWVREQLPTRGRRVVSARPVVLGRLFEARQRARGRRGEVHPLTPDASPLPPHPQPLSTMGKGESPPALRSAEQEPASDADTLSRLRDAKKRARRD